MSEVCYHCGLNCKTELIVFNEKNFCCNGCKSVYEILNTDSLKTFYELNKNPGIRPQEAPAYEFDFLDETPIKDHLLLYQDEDREVIRFHIPVIHCSSCVWVLENLTDLKEGIYSSQVKFTQKTLLIQYNPKKLSLKKLAAFLATIGYKPIIKLEEENQESLEHIDNQLLVKLGVAGFCFGNVMLFAFPEYFTEHSDLWFERYKIIFRYLMLGLSLPVVFYCASDYFRSAWSGIKHGIVNIDIPISIGIAVLFLRSVYEVAFDISSGYFDSLCGLVFFMLIGKYFQQNTYKSLSFDRNYKSFYPLSITKITEQGPKIILLSEVKKGDKIKVRNGELIPADSVLLKGKAYIDNSFITGESAAAMRSIGEKIFAGGKQVGEAIELEIIKDVNQSYLTSLWQNAGQDEGQTYFSTLIEQVSRYFTFAVLLIALLGGILWYFIDPSMMFQVLTAVLIVACPCALALSTPFTLGNIMRILGAQQIYTKDIQTIEKLNMIDDIVLDKTGTLTHTDQSELKYKGTKLSNQEKSELATICQNSTHPLSRNLFTQFKNNIASEVLEGFQEIEGKGLKASINQHHYRIGSLAWLDIKKSQKHSTVGIEKNGEVLGVFEFVPQYRSGLSTWIKQLQKYTISIISGDNSAEEQSLTQKLGVKLPMYFEQSPEDKLAYIRKAQNQNRKVMMVGDGLNDAAALKQSDVGVAITDDMSQFTPASDLIMKGERLKLLPQIFILSQKGVQLVKSSMLISFLYNIIGLGFALSGLLSPLVAAILMPISSISVVVFASVSTWYFGNRIFK